MKLRNTEYISLLVKRRALFCAAVFLLTVLYARNVRPENLPAAEENYLFASGDTTSKESSFSGVFSARHARAAQERASYFNALRSARNASAARFDSLLLAHRDSSARVAQFIYVRKDDPAVDPSYHKNIPLFLNEPLAVYYKDELDSTRWVYRIRRVVDDIDTRIPLDIPLEEYTDLRMKKAIKKNWESIEQSSESTLQKQDALAGLLSKMTNIEIPIPQTPLFSIFGKNYVRFQISGGIDLHAAFQNVKSDLYTTTANQSTSTPEFSQQLQFNLSGEVGDKLKVTADWNTQRTFDYENQMHINYKGYDDEIIQSVEAGNVSLQTNSSFISSSQALFGIKMGMQFGPLKLTAIASQKKGQVKELSVNNGSTSAAFSIRPSAYSQNHYFIDTSYIRFYGDYYLRHPHFSHAERQVQNIEVWVSRIGTVSTKERKVIAYMSQDTVQKYMVIRPPASMNFSGIGDGEMEAGPFVMLTNGTDYTVNMALGIISLKTALQTSQAIAVAYNYGPAASSTLVGNFGSTTTGDSSWLVMKLVRPKNLASNPFLKTGWKMMLKSHYPVGGGGITQKTFSMTIQYQSSGQTPVDNVLSKNIGVMTMLGMDLYSGSTNDVNLPDKVFDYNNDYTVDEARGEIIFPTVQPFDSSSIAYFLRTSGNLTDPDSLSHAADSLNFKSLYDTTSSAADVDIRSRYTITGTATSSVQSQYPIGTNIIEGSVVVTVDGQPAVLNTDYTVDYVSGTVTIRNSSFLVGGRNVQIKYEANDLFQLASKTLLGVRGEFAVDRNTMLGFTVMNLNEQSLTDKVRLGDEPTNNTIYGLNASTNFDAPFLTKALNWLPGIHTIEKSQISLRGEYAYMSPDPNTRTSPLPEDGGKSVAYIDDFEGTLQTMPISLAYTSWKEAAPPFYSSMIDTAFVVDPVTKIIPTAPSNTIMGDSAKMEYKAHTTWFTIATSDVQSTDIWGQRKSVISGQSQVTVLNMYFDPSRRGTYNYSQNLYTKLFPNPAKAWGGAQLVLGSSTTNLSDQNINYIQMWVKIVGGQPTVKLNIDLGYISENSLPYGDSLNTEDDIKIPTGSMSKEKDLGIDRLIDAQEDSTFTAFLDSAHVHGNKEYDADPSGDDWKAPPTSIVSLDTGNATQFDGCNGVEGNYASELGARFPDTEDLNGDGIFSMLNSYFEYELPLDTNNAVFKYYTTGQGENGWHQISIPLKDITRQIGTPSLTDIQGMRVWMTGASGKVLVRMTNLYLVGNQWRAEIPNDTTMQVSAINYEDNPNYNNPFVPRIQDPTQTTQKVLENEQSLDLIVRGLAQKDSRRAVKLFGARPINLLNYHTMKMLLHGDTGEVSKGYKAFIFNDTSDYDVRISFRFGTDSANYYEYSAPLRPGWDPVNNDMIIHFADLASLKALSDTNGNVPHNVPNGPPGSKYLIKGFPTLTAIQYLAIEVKNVSDSLKYPGKTINGEVWVDELRLTDVDNTPGSAYKIDANIKLADVATIGFSLSHISPTFHALEDQFGNHTDMLSWSLSSTINFDKFLPESWTGTQLALTYSHSEDYQRPQYVPGSDVLVDQAAQQVAAAIARGDTVTSKPDDIRLAAQTLTVRDSYALPSLRFNIPLDTWLITKTINQMVFGYSYSSTFQRSPTVEWSKSWTWEAHMSYVIQFSQTNYFKPFHWLGKFFLTSIWQDLTIYFTPREINTAVSFNRSQSQSQTRYQDSPNPFIRSLTASRSLNFTWQWFEGRYLDLGTSYQINIGSNLDNLGTDRFGNLRSFYDILKDLFLTDRLVDFGVDQNYSQGITFNPQIKIPNTSFLGSLIRPSLQYTTQYSWSDNISSGALGKSATTNSSFRFSLDVNLHTISEALWSPDAASSSMPKDTTRSRGLKKASQQLSSLTRFLFKDILFDFDKVSISFTDGNNIQNTGVTGGTGFSNIFARVPIFQSSLPENGPSLLYQLGLSSDPNGKVVLGTKNTFPFFAGYTIPGLRAGSDSLATTLSDVFSQNNTISMATGRTLWEGARIDLNWNYSWSYNANQTMQPDSFGRIQDASISRTISGTFQRSFLFFPDVFIFKIFNTNIGNVDKKYEALKSEDTLTNDKRLSIAFQQGFEAFPFLSQLLGSMLPRVNWSFHWSGLEKFSLFKSFASSISLEHAYTSNYREQWNTQTTGPVVVSSEGVSYAFSPLIGLNIDFKGLGKGTMSASCRYSTGATFDLTPASYNATETDQSDITAIISYRQQGFNLPLFGISLSNDVEGSMSYSVSNSSSVLYSFQPFTAGGTPLSGMIRTTVVPSIKYTLSSRITAKIYYSYTRIAPTSSGSNVTGSTSNEGGLDVHIAIQ